MSEDDRTVFTAMREKDPELFGQLGGHSIDAAMWLWVEKYPDDFPLRGATPVSDLSAIKPLDATTHNISDQA